MTLSFKKYNGIRYGTTQVSRNIVAKCFNVILTVEIVLVRLEYLSLIITTCWVPNEVLGNGPKVSIAPNLSGLSAGKVEAFVYASLEIRFGHIRDTLLVLYIRHLPCMVSKSVVSLCHTYVFLSCVPPKSDIVSDTVCGRVRGVGRTSAMHHSMVLVVPRGEQSSSLGDGLLSKLCLRMNSSKLGGFSVALCIVLRGWALLLRVGQYSPFQPSHHSAGEYKTSRNHCRDHLLSCSLPVPPLIPSFMVDHPLIWCCLFHQFQLAIVRQRLGPRYQLYDRIPIPNQGVGTVLALQWRPRDWGSISTHRHR